MFLDENKKIKKNKFTDKFKTIYARLREVYIKQCMRANLILFWERDQSTYDSYIFIHIYGFKKFGWGKVIFYLCLEESEQNGTSEMIGKSKINLDSLLFFACKNVCILILVRLKIQVNSAVKVI